MITAKDIRESAFSRSARGYKVSEVDDLLEDAAVAMEKLSSENETLLKKMELLAAKIQEYRNDEDNIRAALLTAQRSADKIVREANEQKETILLEANAKAKEILDDANARAEEAIKSSQEKSILLVSETKEKATLVINEAKDKAGRMLTEAREGSREERENLEHMKKQALEFRSALIQMYKDQFEMIKTGRMIRPAKTDDQPSEEVQETKDQETETAPAEPAVEEIVQEEPKTEPAPVPVDPVDIPIPVSNSVAERNAKEAESAETEETPAGEPISGGFTIKSPQSDKFSSLKFGEDYDMSKDDDYDDEDEDGKSRVFSRRRK